MLKYSIADEESCVCCNTDESGCFLCCRDCHCNFKCLSHQVNLLFIGFLQFCFTAYGFSNGYNDWDKDFDLLLIIAGSEVILLILATFVSYFNSTDFKCCLCCFRIDRYYRHGGTYIHLLSHMVTKDFHKDPGFAQHQPPEVTSDDNVGRGHPKHTREYLRFKVGSDLEEQALKQLMEHHHNRLYAKAFPSSPLPAPSRLSGAQIKLLDEFYSDENNLAMINSDHGQTNVAEMCHA